MTRTILLTRGKVATVDDADYVWLSQWKWFTHSNGYAVRNTRLSEDRPRGIVYMHREIVGASAEVEVDHRDRDKLNNQRHNLRACTTAENQQNRAPRAGRDSHYKGVRWDADRRRWRARIVINGKEQHLGRFGTEEDAARAYDEAARRHFGEFARTNF